MATVVEAVSNLVSPSQSVLLLGSGFVAKPCLDYLSEKGIAVTVGMLSPRL
jgi:hypothetical protein